MRGENYEFARKVQKATKNLLIGCGLRDSEVEAAKRRALIATLNLNAERFRRALEESDSLEE